MARVKRDKSAESDWLESAMTAAGLGPSDLEAKIGDADVVTANFISQWKNGTRTMPDIAMLKIAKFFGLSPYELRPYLAEYRDFYRDASILDGLSPDSRRLVLASIKQFETVEAAAKSFQATKPVSGYDQAHGFNKSP